MASRNRLERILLKAPASLGEEAFDELLEAARYLTFMEAGSAMKFTTASFFTNLGAAALIVLCSTLALLSDQMESAPVVAKGLVVGLCILTFGGAAFLINTYIRARFIQPRFLELLQNHGGVD